MIRTLSRSTARDPMQSKTLRTTYERKLVALFRRYRAAALASLDLARENEARALEPTPIQIAWLVGDLDRLAQQAVLSPGEAIVNDMAKSGYRQGATFAERALARIGISSKLGEGPADWRVIDVLQVRNLTALKGIVAETNKAIVRSLTEGINAGEGVVKLRKRLMKEVEGIGYNRARLMAHTETMYASNEGAKIRYSQHGIRRVQWLTAGHDNTCERCQALNGKIFDIDKAPMCPCHPFCRCTLLPVLDDEAEDVDLNGFIPYADRQDLTRSEIAALKGYQDIGLPQHNWDFPIPAIEPHHDCFIVNNHLRGFINLGERDRTQVKSTIDTIDNALDKSRTERDVEVFKGVSDLDWLKKTKIGTEFDDEAFGSFSLSAEKARGYAGVNKNGEYILLHLDVPAGSNALFMDTKEYELLLPRGWTYTINKITHLDPSESYIGEKTIVYTLRNIRRK